MKKIGLILSMKTIDVLGLGESILDYKNDGSETIGVNDIYKHYPVDYLLVMDQPHRFTKDRLATILLSTPKKFYSNVRDDSGKYIWGGMPNFIPILTEKGRGNLKSIDEPDLYSLSNNSPFTACVMAYKMGAKRIVLYGVDLNTHRHLSSENMLSTILVHYKNLFEKLKDRGVGLFVSSEKSKLSAIIPVFQTDFLP